ncbi:MAG TPA: hypothetical protein PLY54_02045 [Ottowia sp.]|nr:hypothetical protein [Ottowia sp.]
MHDAKDAKMTRRTRKIEKEIGRHCEERSDEAIHRRMTHRYGWIASRHAALAAKHLLPLAMTNAERRSACAARPPNRHAHKIFF